MEKVWLGWNWVKGGWNCWLRDDDRRWLCSQSWMLTLFGHSTKTIKSITTIIFSPQRELWQSWTYCWLWWWLIHKAEPLHCLATQQRASAEELEAPHRQPVQRWEEDFLMMNFWWFTLKKIDKEDKGRDNEPAAIAEATPLWDHQTSVLLADFHIHSWDSALWSSQPRRGGLAREAKPSLGRNMERLRPNSESHRQVISSTRSV